MNGRVGISSKYWRVLRWVGFAVAAPALWACTSRTLEAPQITPTANLTTKFNQKINNEIDILFMIDDSSSMTSMQQKLLAQLPTFMQVLQNLPSGLPSLHVAVVSQDMGAPGDSTAAIGCTNNGKDGVFQYAPEGTCTATTLTAGSTFISDVDMMPNFTDPIGTVFQCIALLGAKGCGFEHQLAAIDRALGADGNGAPPMENTSFLRPEAYLGIVMLTNEDDCSATPPTTIYSLNGFQQNIANPDGPIQNFRCNGGPRGAHYCQDPNSANPMAYATPPLMPPGDATGNPPRLPLVNCEDNESGTSALTPVTKFISDIKALKMDPDNQILVAGIIAPPTPYAVEWDPESGGQSTQPGELWPAVQHSCGPDTSAGPMVNPDSKQFTTDGSFGDPGVREAQFLNAFQNSVQASICDPSYAASMTAIATKLGQLITPPCITGKIQNDSQGQPECSVVEHLTDMQNNKKDIAIQNCQENGNTSPCWTLVPGGTGCAAGSQLMITDTANTNLTSESSTVDCSILPPGACWDKPGAGLLRPRGEEEWQQARAADAARDLPSPASPRPVGASLHARGCARGRQLGEAANSAASEGPVALSGRESPIGPAAGFWRWPTMRLLGKKVGLASGCISDLFRENGLQLYLVRTNRDPAFTATVKDVVGLYLNPPTNAVVLSVDEKTSIQALQRTQMPLPLCTGGAARHTHDHKRHGVVDLYAALEMATGKVTLTS